MKSITPIFNEVAGYENANLEVIIDHAELTQGTAATAQTIDLFPLDASFQMVELVRSELLQPFEDTTDPANNSTAVTVGDGGDTARLLTATQLNRNGSTVFIKGGTTARHVFGAADTVDIVFAAPPAGKNLAALNKGRLRLLFRVHDSRKNQ